ncbi:MAG: nitrate/nitrite transporter NrtS [Rhodanobacteraceae bacterium]
MIAILKSFARVIFMPVHLKRTVLIALAVGTWLNLFNHGDELIRGVMSAHLAGKLVLNYLTPFIVSNIGLLAHRTS